MICEITDPVDCTGKKIKRYMLDFKERYEPNPLAAGWTTSPVDGWMTV
ncbi:MAG: hypothetical protein QNL62_05715 [Gammaproteobacteria bacterium]|nr:hypothetical protein [Gammaproteobacteria bacterium]